jgi:hypothetical protein
MNFLLPLIFCICFSQAFAQSALPAAASATASSMPTWCASLTPYCSCSEGILVCDNFTKFSQLDFSSLKNLTSVSTLVVEPRGVALDLRANSLKLGELAVGTFVMRNIKSFPFSTRLFANATKRLQQHQQQQREQENNISEGVELEISHSTLVFSLSDAGRRSLPKQCLNQSFIDQLLVLPDPAIKDRHSDTDADVDAYMPSFFAYLSAVRLGERVDFPEPLCNLLFRNAYITELEVTQINERSRLSFINNTHMNNMNLLNSTIKSMKILNSSLAGLDETLLERRTFAELNMFTLMESGLKYVDEHRSPFDALSKLNVIGFNLNNWDEFIESSSRSLEWLRRLNKKEKEHENTEANDGDEKKKNKDKQQLMASPFLNNELIFGLAGDELGRREYDYKFPEKHLCYFEGFPHTNLVYPYVYFKSKLNCTCTLMWLLKNWKRSSTRLVDLNTTSVIDCIDDEAAFQAALDACHFEKRFEQCHSLASQSADATFSHNELSASKAALPSGLSVPSAPFLSSSPSPSSQSSSSSSSQQKNFGSEQARPSASFSYCFSAMAALASLIQYFI